MRRRMVGYSPAAVAEALRQGHQRHSEEMERLRQDLARAREKSATLAKQLVMGEAKAQSTAILVHTLTGRILEWVNQRASAIRDFEQRSAQAENELRAEVERLHAVLIHLEESQSKFGTDLGTLTRRFRDEVASLRHNVPTPSQEPVIPGETVVSQPPQPQIPGGRKESAIR